jgi:hypothetical protein
MREVHIYVLTRRWRANLARDRPNFDPRSVCVYVNINM